MMNLEDAVLLAIANGLNNPKDIARKLNVRSEDVEIAIGNLEAEGLIVKRTKGIIFKKEVYELTESGFNRVERIKEELRRIASDFRRAYESGDRIRLERLYHDYHYLIPLMITFGLLDLIWLSLFLDDFDVDFGDVEDSGFDLF